MSDQLSEEEDGTASTYRSGGGSCVSGPDGADYHGTVDALRLVRDALLMGDWFVERPPLALAFAHPYTRLWCEMWRTEYVGDLYAPAEHKLPVAESLHRARGNGSAGSAAGSPSSFVRIGLRRLRNPAAVADTASPGGADILSRGISLTSPSSVLSSALYATAAQRPIRSLVAPVPTYPEPAAAAEPAPLYDTASVRGIPVVDPTASLFTLETYTEQAFRMPIGMRLGHVRLLTLWLPFDSPSHTAEGNRRARLVRGLFSHVPASVTHSAANKAATCIHAAETERAGGHGPHTLRLPEVSAPHIGAECCGVTVLNSDSDAAATIDEGSDAMAEKDSVYAKEAAKDDDWEAIALEEEGLLEQQPPSISAAEAVATAVPPTTRESCPSLQVTPSARIPSYTSTSHDPSLPAAGTRSTTTAPCDTRAVASAPEQRGNVSVSIEGVCVALPPPCGWWLRRRVRPSSLLQGAPLPLYAHCIDATRQWLDWLEATACATSDRAPSKGGDSPAQAFLCGVSLSGWSTKYVQPTVVSRAEFVRRSVPVKLEDAVSSTLPLRGLHIESSVGALKRLLGGPAAFRGTLIALDTPYLRCADPDVRTGRDRLSVSNDGGVECLGSALLRLPQLRFLCINHGRDVLAEMSSSLPGHSTFHNTCIEELLLHGATGLTARALASVGRCCVSLRTVDLTSTSLTDEELLALVYGTWETLSKESEPAEGPARSSPLVCLEEMRLTACRSLTRVDALGALPRLRRVDLHASAVRQISDLVGCLLLEEVVLTRCEHLTELHPLWRLPRLRCVEADGVRQLQQHRALLPPFASAAEADESDAHFLAPLLRLNLSQAATIRGASVGYLARHLRDASRHATSLVVLLLDHTEVDDNALRALAGFPTEDEEEIGRFTARRLPLASSLRELSLIGCTRVHHLGSLGALPQLTRLVADHSGAERVDGLQHCPALDYLSLSHCTRLWVISPLAFAPSLRCVDVSGTPVNDSALLRFVYPGVVEEVMAQRHANFGEIVASLQACTTSLAPLAPSKVEELRMCHCMSLLHIGCVAHLPRLRRLYVNNTAVLDRGFVGFFGHVEALLRTQLWLRAHPVGVGADDTEALRSTPMPDEAALLTAWRRSGETAVVVPRDARAASGRVPTDCAAANAVKPPHPPEFDFVVGALDTLAHVSLSYCVEVRCIAVFALFPRLASLDVTGTAVDSASLLAFVNVLLEGCSSGAADGSPMRLEMEGSGLRPRAIRAPSRRTGPAASLSRGGDNTDSTAVEPPRRCRRPFALTTLTLAWCHYLTDVRCCAAVPSLRHLDLSGAPVDNTSILAFSSRETCALESAASEGEAQWWRHHRCSLLTLDVSGCRRVTDIAPLFETPSNSFGGGSSRRREPLGYCHSVSLTELRLRHSGVTSTKEELRALDPFGRCAFVQ
ncbi:hypothetical protein LSCM1_08281 [Leishmania martiniquensis]|uniref:Leucine-rich repeat protein n=1 Tax=Leishmania martiniquensis TaxID=1580590 RepID=A0A836H703_9TRYP|nr:hypothetical protein LSCM1_08281 [Leishmania martiniquensis]